MGNITFTQFITGFMSVVGGISVILGTANLLVDTWNRAHKPSRKQDEMIAKHTNELSDVNKKLSMDEARLDAQEESNRLIMKSIMALLSHGINGNNIDQMKEALDSLQTHLINH